MKKLIEFFNIDANSNVSRISNIDSFTWKGDNIYVDRNPFDILIADPIKKMQYHLHNIYQIIDGSIYVIGFATTLKIETGSPAGLLTVHDRFNCWLNIMDNRLNLVKFNPNYFNQLAQESTYFSVADRRNYKKYSKCTYLYDLPSNPIQKLFFISGMNLAIESKFNRDDLKEAEALIKDKTGAHFSMQSFYIAGMEAVVTYNEEKEQNSKSR